MILEHMQPDNVSAVCTHCPIPAPIFIQVLHHHTSLNAHKVMCIILSCQQVKDANVLLTPSNVPLSPPDIDIVFYAVVTWAMLDARHVDGYK